MQDSVGWQMSIKIDLSTKFGFPAAHYTRKNLDWLLLVAANSLAIIAEHLDKSKFNLMRIKNICFLSEFDTNFGSILRFSRWSS